MVSVGSILEGKVVSVMPFGAFVDIGNKQSAEISIRKAGVVLGGNVSFKNVVLSLVNGNHALIAANGYTLTLDNVTYFQNTREVHIVGGTLYDKNGVSLSPTAG